MTSEDSQQGPITRRRLLLIVLILFVSLLAIVFFTTNLSVGTYAHFGPIYEAVAYDLNEARSNQVGVFLRTHVPRRIVESPYFPTRLKYQPRYLDLKGTRLEWSIAGTNTGWLYFYGRPDQVLGTNRWQFAPCIEGDFMNLGEIPTDYYGSSDPRRTKVFGDSSSGNAIKVSVGQILFARRTDETSRVYVLKLKEQDRNRLLLNYCMTDQKNSRTNGSSQ